MSNFVPEKSTLQSDQITLTAKLARNDSLMKKSFRWFLAVVSDVNKHHARQLKISFDSIKLVRTLSPFKKSSFPQAGGLFFKFPNLTCKSVVRMFFEHMEPPRSSWVRREESSYLFEIVITHFARVTLVTLVGVYYVALYVGLICMVFGSGTELTSVLFDERVTTSTADVHLGGTDENLTLLNIVLVLVGLFCFLFTVISTVCWCNKLLVKGRSGDIELPHLPFLELLHEQPFVTHIGAFLNFLISRDYRGSSLVSTGNYLVFRADKTESCTASVLSKVQCGPYISKIQQGVVHHAPFPSLVCFGRLVAKWYALHSP